MKISLIVFTSIFFINSLFSSTELTINSSSGEVTGKRNNNVIVYEDIPYAKPPIGNLRWKAPRAINSNERIVPKDNNFCVQRPSNLGGVDSDNFFVGSEDCLYLDIFKPINKDSQKKFPVMFWIHGGGNTSGLKDLYDFSKMVKKHDVIVVRINYRLGHLGWFTHPAIQNFQFGDDKSSNFGTLDIIMALKWVNQNINLFGGDKNNITIFGESAGGHNVLSLIASKKASSLFHKAISMSGYTTSISPKEAYKQIENSPTSEYTSSNIIGKIANDNETNVNDLEKVRSLLLEISTENLFKYYSDRKSYQELPLLTADDIVIPSIGLKNALSKKEFINNVPTIFGSNRDEVKLWLASADYFVDVDYSLIGSILNIPKITLTNEESFEAFNYYRSSAWKIRGVDNPLISLSNAGNKNLYAYRFDWDDHRRILVADFKKLIGAAHATEIPLLTGNMDLVGGYPISSIIYPPSLSKRFISKNMMRLWTNFAKTGEPGITTNSIKWMPFNHFESKLNFIVLDNKKNVRMSNEMKSFEILTEEINIDTRLSDLEKCVVLFQMFTYVGDDLYQENIKNYPKKCNRSESEKFIKQNASYIEY